MFRVVDGLDDEAVVAREVEETPGLAGTSQLGEDVLAREGKQIVGGIEMKVLAQLAEDPWRIVLEFEVVLGRRRKLVANSGLPFISMSRDGKKIKRTCRTSTCAQH